MSYLGQSDLLHTFTGITKRKHISFDFYYSLFAKKMWPGQADPGEAGLTQGDIPLLGYFVEKVSRELKKKQRITHTQSVRP